MQGVHEVPRELGARQRPAPSQDQPCPRRSQGSRWLCRPLVPSCFQVWLCLSVMSACPTGTQPSSVLCDGMGVLPQAGAGLGHGQGMGKELCVPGVRAVGVGEAGEKV